MGEVAGREQGAGRFRSVVSTSWSASQPSSLRSRPVSRGTWTPAAGAPATGTAASRRSSRTVVAVVPLRLHGGDSASESVAARRACSTGNGDLGCWPVEGVRVGVASRRTSTQSPARRAARTGNPAGPPSLARRCTPRPSRRTGRHATKSSDRRGDWWTSRPPGSDDGGDLVSRPSKARPAGVAGQRRPAVAEQVVVDPELQLHARRRTDVVRRSNTTTWPCWPATCGGKGWRNASRHRGDSRSGGWGVAEVGQQVRRPGTRTRRSADAVGGTGKRPLLARSKARRSARRPGSRRRSAGRVVIPSWRTACGVRSAWAMGRASDHPCGDGWSGPCPRDLDCPGWVTAHSCGSVRTGSGGRHGCGGAVFIPTNGSPFAESATVASQLPLAAATCPSQTLRCPTGALADPQFPQGLRELLGREFEPRSLCNIAPAARRLLAAISIAAWMSGVL